jgi:protease secretion system membrane fusion protein
MTEQNTRKERSAGFFVGLGWLLALFGAGSFFIWAALAPLNQGIPVQGTVVVSGKRKAVQSVDNGVLRRIMVREGQVVQQGQPLFQLDHTQAQADVQSLQAQQQLAEASVARLQAERDGSPQVIFPQALLANAAPDVSNLLEGQRQLFNSRRHAYEGAQAGTRALIEGGIAQLAGMRQARVDLQAQADSLRQQLQNLRSLAENGYIARNRLLDYDRQLSQVQRDLAQSAGDTGRIAQQVEQSRLSLKQGVEEYQKEVRTQLADAQLKSQTLTQQLASAQFSLTHSEIGAPSDGIAVNLAVHTEGAVVRAGETLVEIVPQGSGLEVEGHLPVQMVDKVSEQLPVDILFTAFNQSRTPRVAGEVSLISADQMLDERSGQPYYVLRSSVSEQAMAKLQGLVIKPGMPAQMFVRTGERSLLNYLFKPLMDRAGLALTEE